MEINTSSGASTSSATPQPSAPRRSERVHRQLDRTPASSGEQAVEWSACMKWPFPLLPLVHVLAPMPVILLLHFCTSFFFLIPIEEKWEPKKRGVQQKFQTLLQCFMRGSPDSPFISVSPLYWQVVVISPYGSAVVKMGSNDFFSRSGIYELILIMKALQSKTQGSCLLKVCTKKHFLV